MELTSSHKYIKNTSTCGTLLTEHLLNAGRRPQTSERARKSPCNWVGQKKEEKLKREKGTMMGPEPLGGSCERRNVSTPWEIPSLVGRSVGMEGELWSLGEECSNWFAEGKMERNVHRQLVLVPCALQPEMLVCWCRRGLGAEAQLWTSDPERGLGLVVWRQPEGAGVWCSHNRGCTWKKPGPIREAS